MTQYVPAQPGFFVLYPEDKNAPTLDDVLKIPVVAWKIGEAGEGDYDKFGIPVCIESIFDCKPLYILTPDGQVYEPELAVWSSLEAWFKSERNEKIK